jgi:rhamnosyltransferase
LVYGKQRGGKSTKYSEHQIFRKWFPGHSNSRQDHPFCNNANAAIRRKLWKGLSYNERLTGLEDLDWAKRAMAKGYYIAYSAEAEIIHVHNETLPHIYNRYQREGMAHKQIFPGQKFTLLDFVKTFTGNVIADYYHAWRDGAFQDNLNIPLFRLMQFWGTYRGFAKSGPITNKLKERFYYPNSFRRNKIEQVKHSQEGKRIDYAKLEKDDRCAKDH